MSILYDLLLLLFLLWLGVWRLLGDRNGWLALANAWAWWLLAGAIPAGIVNLWRQSRLASLAWGIGVAGLWLREFGWTLPFQDSCPESSQIPRIGAISSDRPEVGGLQTADTPLSLLTFNLLNKERDLTPVLEMAVQETPDLLLFQECIECHVAQLERGLARDYPHRLWLPATEYGMGFGMVSRLPFALTGFWAYPGFEPFAARITLPICAFTQTDAHAKNEKGAIERHCPSGPGDTIDIYCVQFISPTNEVRRVGPTALLHLRERQIDWVLGEIERRGRTALVAGDWNTTEGTDAYRQATVQLVDGWREAGCGPGWSWPLALKPFLNRSTPPMLRLDYLMHTGSRYTPEVTVAEIQVIRENLGSDHCPLLAKVAVEDREPVPLAGDWG